MFYTVYTLLQWNHGKRASWGALLKELVGMVFCTGTYVTLLGVLGIKPNIFWCFFSVFTTAHHPRVVAIEEKEIAVVGVEVAGVALIYVIAV